MNCKRISSTISPWCSGLVVLLLLTGLARAQSNLVTFQFNGTIDFTHGDLTYFPGLFGSGARFSGTMTFETAARDINDQIDQLGGFILPSPPSAFTLSVTDLMGGTYDFTAVAPYVLIYDSYLGISRVDAGSDHFTAYGRDFLFGLSFYDDAHALVASDQLRDFAPGASWDRVIFNMSSSTGVPSISGQAVVVPEPGTLGLWSLGAVILLHSVLVPLRGPRPLARRA